MCDVARTCRVEHFDADPHPNGLEMSEQTLQYSNGDGYEVAVQFLHGITWPAGHCLCRSGSAQGLLCKSQANLLCKKKWVMVMQGQTLGTMRHGKGVHMCSNGDTYRGYWRLDKRHGRGKASFASGVQYEGDWIDDKANGSGAAAIPARRCLHGTVIHAHRPKHSSLTAWCCAGVALRGMRTGACLRGSSRLSSAGAGGSTASPMETCTRASGSTTRSKVVTGPCHCPCTWPDDMMLALITGVASAHARKSTSTVATPYQALQGVIVHEQGRAGAPTQTGPTMRATGQEASG